MNKTKIIALLMSCLMVIGLIPGTVFAADSACEHDYQDSDPSMCTKCGADDMTRYGQCKENDPDKDGKCDVCGSKYKHDCDQNGVKFVNAGRHQDRKSVV